MRSIFDHFFAKLSAFIVFVLRRILAQLRKKESAVVRQDKHLDLMMVHTQQPRHIYVPVLSAHNRTGNEADVIVAGRGTLRSAPLNDLSRLRLSFVYITDKPHPTNRTMPTRTKRNPPPATATVTPNPIRHRPSTTRTTSTCARGCDCA